MSNVNVIEGCFVCFHLNSSSFTIFFANYNSFNFSDCDPSGLKFAALTTNINIGAIQTEKIESVCVWVASNCV